MACIGSVMLILSNDIGWKFMQWWRTVAKTHVGSSSVHQFNIGTTIQCHHDHPDTANSRHQGEWPLQSPSPAKSSTIFPPKALCHAEHRLVRAKSYHSHRRRRPCPMAGALGRRKSRPGNPAILQFLHHNSGHYRDSRRGLVSIQGCAQHRFEDTPLQRGAQTYKD